MQTVEYLLKGDNHAPLQVVLGPELARQANVGACRLVVPLVEVRRHGRAADRGDLKDVVVDKDGHGDPGQHNERVVRKGEGEGFGRVPESRPCFRTCCHV